MTSTSLSGSWIQHAKPSTRARVRLFCFAYAGGGASYFRTWQGKLPPEIEVCPVQIPGRENRIGEQPYTELLPLVQDLSRALQPYLTTLPFVFFGHSMGGLISFELARQLRREKAPTPIHLLVSAHRAPQVPDPDPPIHQLPDLKFMEELRKLNGTPEEVLKNAELMQVMLPILRADFSICETYTYTDEKPLNCPISAFGGLGDEEVSKDDMAAWRKQAAGFFRLRMFEGDHFYLNSTQEVLLGAIMQDLLPHLNRVR